MIIIERIISEYTHYNIIVGVFENIENANTAKKKYIDYCRENDKWSKQAYRTVNLEEDIRCINVSKLLQNNINSIKDELYVINYFMEGFGQVSRKIDKIFTNNSDAEQYLKTKNQEPEYEPSWYEIEILRINEIYYEK